MPLAAMGERIVPATVPEDDDDVVVSLETARVSEEREDLEAASKWLHRAAAAARRQGRPERAGALSRFAAQVLGEQRFERKPDEEKILGEFEDDFTDSTIVETAAEIAKKAESDSIPAGSEPSESTPLVTQPAPLLTQPAAPLTQPTPLLTQPTPLLTQPTPIAPLLDQPKAAAHQALRVAVRKVLGGKFEARPLGALEVPRRGEQEALLVPVQGGTKFS